MHSNCVEVAACFSPVQNGFISSVFCVLHDASCHLFVETTKVLCVFLEIVYSRRKLLLMDIVTLF